VRAALAALALAALAPGVAAAQPAPAAAPIAIEGATIWIDPATRLERATLVIAGGTIAAVGADVRVPAGARRIDGAGLVVTAGLIDADSRVGLVEVDLVASTVEGQWADGVHAAYRAIDAYDPRSMVVPVARTGGITSVIASPIGGLLAGQAAWIALADGERAALAIAAPAALRGGLVAPGGRGAAFARLRELIADARFLAAHRAAFDRAASRDLAAPRADLEALAPLLARRIPLVLDVDRAADVDAAIELAREAGIRVAIRGGAEAWQVAGRLAAAKIPVIVTPSQNLPDGFDRRHVRDDGAARLRAAGVEVVIATGGAHGARALRQECGLAVRAGLAWADALAAVTTAPAGAFGGGARGTLARGAPADVVVWTGDPFELSTRAVHVIVGGVEQSLRTHQSALLERYR
jgi:imidazolonepropionase-like amidohydrolase